MNKNLDKSNRIEPFLYNKLKPGSKIKGIFSGYFPNATEIEWAPKKNNLFEVSFIQDGSNKIACINISGNLEELKTYIIEDDLPDSVSSIINNTYKKEFIISLLRVEKAGILLYEIEFESEDKTRYLLQIDEKGHIIKDEQLFIMNPGLIN